MKFPLIVRCTKCGNQITVETTGDERYPNACCNLCGTTIWIFDNGRVSYRTFARATVELVKEDWSLAIILSAISVETELAYLYSKAEIRRQDSTGYLFPRIFSHVTLHHDATRRMRAMRGQYVYRRGTEIS
jgi:hypothetical protein